LKPFIPASTELIHRVYALSSGQYALSIGLIHRFALHADGESQFKKHASGIWPITKKALGEKAILDEGIPKQNGEFLAYGSAYSYQQNEAQPVLAKVKVGSTSKRLAVFGDRTINTANWISEPRMFKEMPITPANAFGGKDYKANPLGKGYQKTGDPAKGKSQWPMPNIEDPEHLMALQSDTPLPAGFWAISSELPQRSELLGKLDEAWLKKRWPHIPFDTNPNYHQTAPTDQRIQNYFQGNESLEILNMHPQHACIQTTLPNLRARIFVERVANNSDHEFVELISNLETIWLLPGQLTGLILFRGKVEASNYDADNVINVYAVLESLTEAPKDIQFHYQNYLLEIGKGGAAIKPEAIVEEANLAAKAPAESTATLAEIEIPQVEIKPPASPATKPESVESTIDSNPEIKKLMQQFNITDDEIKNRMTQMANPEIPSPQEAMQEAQKAIQQLLQLLEGSKTSNDELIKMLASRPEGAQAAAMLSNTPGGLAGMIKTLEQELSKGPPKMPEAPSAAQKKPPTEAPPAPSIKIDRQWVIAHHQDSKSFKGLELNGLDLSNLDLSKADFSKAQLMGVNFQKSILIGTLFDEALLTESDFSAANLSNASLKKVSAGKCRLPGANLSAAILSDANFTSSDFSNANLTEANLKKANFHQSKMSAVNATAINAESVAFDECSMEASIFKKAHLKMATFVKSKLTNSQFEQASCLRTDFTGADVSNSNFTQAILFDSEAHKDTSFESCNFSQAKMNGINWQKANLKNAVLTQAELNQADFTGSNLERATIIKSIAKNSVFNKTNLEGANLSNSNFFEGSFRGASMINCHLELSNFYGVDFLDAQIQGSVFEGANLDRTILAMRNP